MKAVKQPILIVIVIAGLIVVGAVWMTQRNRVAQPLPAQDPFLRVKELQHKPEGQAYTPQEFEELVKLASDQNDLVRVRALTALFRSQEGEQKRRALEVMHRALHDPSAVVRAYAVSGIERLGSKQDAPALLPLLKDSEPRVRQRAERALRRLGYSPPQGGAP